jgi:hypothetical protein
MSDLATLSQLVRRAIQLEGEIEKAGEAEKGLVDERKEILERDVPEMFLSLGITQLALDGRTITLKAKHRHSIAEGRKEDAFGWLDKNGHGAMLQRRVVVTFGRDSEKHAGALAAELTERFGSDAQVAIERHVAPATLGAFLGEQLKAGRPIPEQPFGLYLTVEAEVKLDKKQKTETPEDQ